MLTCLIYGVLSFTTSFINKKLQVNYGSVSALNLMMGNCIVGLVLSIGMIALEELSPGFFKMTRTGIQVPHFHVIQRNVKLGLKAGLVGLVPVTIGNFCLNYTSIPLYLAFRKCALLSSVIVMYLWAGDRPSKGVFLSTGIVTVGALIAACENLNDNILGFVFVWTYNFS